MSTGFRRPVQIDRLVTHPHPQRAEHARGGDGRAARAVWRGLAARSRGWGGRGEGFLEGGCF
eukprot:4001465-Pyramimonas_sp.AAC.1